MLTVGRPLDGFCDLKAMPRLCPLVAKRGINQSPPFHRTVVCEVLPNVPVARSAAPAYSTVICNRGCR